ncbi:hypothetical protein MVLG_03647 [Microbotryum lychnidis-dioicae p1A1 Lamole]|uniref:Ubiquitin-like protease family profile domain-containing protein n=1 Tax=Microbotryum lychnidis-dioicae (strain p1A1 Lamole / MvSl-1064) TaxID=683840 RepID=U5H8U8_USTV1|nr:hypothetical protein MVLG_03647 [Microbotryum lychnidis-dioicae p1A1 Lamole]|eukprot:KDE05961.1 hypothetical protein MVLG_03647 [Microbotryum lychnidis-dioicae p1A1 Lamole]
MPPINVLSIEDIEIDPIEDENIKEWSHVACIATPKLLNVKLPATDQSEILLSTDAPQAPSEFYFETLPHPPKQARRHFFESNNLSEAKKEGSRSLAVGRYRVPLGFKRIWDNLDNAREARRRIEDALEWMKRVEKECIIDEFYISKAKEALLNLPWHELPGVGNELGHERLVNLLSNEWVGETIINFLIGGIIHTQQLEHTTTIYGLIPSDCISYAIYRMRHAGGSSDVQRLLGQYQFELWLADWARHDCVGIASTAEFISAHPDSVWFLPICDENHWFLGRIDVIDVKLGAWSIHNSLASRTLTVAALNALEALFKVLNLNIDVNNGTTTMSPQQQDTFSCSPAIVNVVVHELVHEKAFDPTHAALSRIRQFCRAVDMIEAQEVTGKRPPPLLIKMPKEHTRTTHDDPLNPSYVPQFH